MAKQWRLSWSMWPKFSGEPHQITTIHDDEEEMRSQLEGLRSMLAEHEPRPCEKHVWYILVEERDVITSAWRRAG